MEQSILRTIVEMTPTKKDDEALSFILELGRKYPFLKSFLFDMLMQIIAHKGENDHNKI